MEMEPRRCDKCGAVVGDNYFCGNCGSVVGDVNTVRNVPPQSSGNSQNPPGKPKKNTGLIAAIVVVIIAILAAIGFVAERYIRPDDEEFVSTRKVSDKDEDKKSDEEEEESKSDGEDEEEEESKSDGEKEEDEKSDEEVKKKSDKEEEKKTETEDKKEVKKEYKKGVLTSTSYESEFIGLRYEAPEGWAMLTEDELEKELPNDAVTTWEVYSMNTTTGSNIIIGVEELITENISIEDYIKAFRQSAESNIGVTIESVSDAGTYALEGDVYNVVEYHASQGGVGYIQKCLLKKTGKYVAVIMVTAADLSGDNIDDILSDFTKY